MIRIFDKNTEDFTTNGLGFLIDFRSSPTIIESLNGNFELTFDYAIQGKNVEYLIAGNIIKAPYDNSEQLFKIKTVTPSLTKLSIYATHIFYDLNDNFLSNVAPTKRTGASAIQWLLDHAMYPTKFKATGDNSTTASARYENKNIVEAILGSDNCVVDTWNGEIERDNFNIIFNDRRGKDSGVYIKYGKNIKDITIAIDYTTIVTRIVPIGKDGLKIDEEYVDSPLIDMYQNPIVRKQEFSDIGEDEETSNEQAQQNLRDACKKLFSEGIDKPTISVKVDWLELSKIDKYREKYSNFEKVRLGDTVTVQALGYEYKIRVIKVEYNPLLEKFTRFEIGDPKSDFVNNQSSIISKELQKNNSNILDQAKQFTTFLINSGFGGHVKIYPDRILIMDTDDELTAQNVWQWNLNGFAHSSTGVNGEYTTGITMNGSIVGDMITTGIIKAARVEGLEDLILAFSKIIDVLAEADGEGFLEMTSNFETTAFELKMHPACQDFPSPNDFDDGCPLGSWLRITYEDGSYNRYQLPPLALRTLNDVYDEINIKSGKVSITKRIGMNQDEELYLLEQEVTTLYDDIPLLLKKGKNTIQLESFTDSIYNIRYMTDNIYTNTFATKIELDTSIQFLQDAINIAVEGKMGKEEANALISAALTNINIELSHKLGEDQFTSAQILMKINNDTSDMQIKADKLNLLGKTFNLTTEQLKIISDFLSITSDGTISLKDKAVTSRDRAHLTITALDNENMYVTHNSLGSHYYEYDEEAEEQFTTTVSSGVIGMYGDSLGTFGDIQISAIPNLNNEPHIVISRGTRHVESQTQITSQGISTPTAYSDSLFSLKKNFEKLEDGLNIVLNTDIYKYHFKYQNNNEKKHIGFVIGRSYKYSKEITSNNNKSVDIYGMIAASYKAIQQQQEEINQLKELINQQQKDIELLKSNLKEKEEKI